MEVWYALTLHAHVGGEDIVPYQEGEGMDLNSFLIQHERELATKLPDVHHNLPRVNSDHPTAPPATHVVVSPARPCREESVRKFPSFAVLVFRDNHAAFGLNQLLKGLLLPLEGVDVILFLHASIVHEEVDPHFSLGMSSLIHLTVAHQLRFRIIKHNKPRAKLFQKTSPHGTRGDDDQRLRQDPGSLRVERASILARGGFSRVQRQVNRKLRIR